MKKFTENLVSDNFQFCTNSLKITKNQLYCYIKISENRHLFEILYFCAQQFTRFLLQKSLKHDFWAKTAFWIFQSNACYVRFNFKIPRHNVVNFSGILYLHNILKQIALQKVVKSLVLLRKKPAKLHTPITKVSQDVKF